MSFDTEACRSVPGAVVGRAETAGANPHGTRDHVLAPPSLLSRCYVVVCAGSRASCSDGCGWKRPPLPLDHATPSVNGFFYSPHQTLHRSHEVRCDAHWLTASRNGTGPAFRYCVQRPTVSGKSGHSRHEYLRKLIIPTLARVKAGEVAWETIGANRLSQIP